MLHFGRRFAGRLHRLLGSTIAKTPSIDRLCADGFVFRNAYTLGSDRGAVCRPSRAMIASGRSYFRPDYYARYKAADIPMPVNFLPHQPFDNGEMTVRDGLTLPWPRTPENVGGKVARYYAAIEYMDAEVGRLVEALKKVGQFDKTIFIVAADNGLSLGEHGLLGKQNLYELGGEHLRA